MISSPIEIFHETGRAFDRASILAAVLRRLQELMTRLHSGGFESIMPLWEAYSALSGQRIGVTQGIERIAGIVAGIDRDGALLIDTATGRKRVVAGEIRLE